MVTEPQQNNHEQDPPVAKPRSKKQGCGRIILRCVGLVIILLLLAAIAAGFAAMLAYRHIVGDGIAGPPVAITIPEGAFGDDIATILATNGLVRHEILFKAAIRLDKSGKTPKAGDYELPMGFSPMQLLHRLQEGPTGVAGLEEVRITIPEGLTVAQIAQRFDDPQAFIEASKDPMLIQQLGISVPTLEGFLMPNTYFFAGQPTPRQVVERMLTQFQTEYTKLIEQHPEIGDPDMLEIVTIASLIEEEARLDDERPIISAVIHNRLRLERPLQFDSTLQYVLNKYGERMLYEDREIDSPYNTYKYPGLPPGPISNPGVASIAAAMAPADVQYLYFVSNADGKSHTFSNTMKEHERAVVRYRNEMRIQRRKQRNEEQ